VRIKNVDIPVIDTDTHIVEPFDLWTSRLPERYRDRGPTVRWNEATRTSMWFLDDRPIFPALLGAHSAWREYPPDGPKEWTDVDVTTYDAKARLARMDNDGIKAQILYPNVCMCNGGRLAGLEDRRLQNEIVRTFNDWQLDWSSAAPDRLLPMASLPFWDLEATLEEIQRCAALGMRGVVFSQNPAAFGLPPISDHHWDRVWALLQESKLPLNFHIGSGDFANSDNLGVGGAGGDPVSTMGRHASYAVESVGIFMANVKTIGQVIFGGVCHRFPDLQIVSVESGVGFIPFVLEAMDWQFLNCGVREEHPEFDLLPSEYFRRQIYGCFWFERECLVHAVEQIGADNLLFETDFPHPTSQTPGPASNAVSPNQYVVEALEALGPDEAQKILHDNAARLYNVA
jgi:uncharacterized protein